MLLILSFVCSFVKVCGYGIEIPALKLTQIFYFGPDLYYSPETHKVRRYII